MTEFQKQAGKIIENLRNELIKIRTSRASTGILEGVLVPYYGQNVPIKACAAINIPDPKTVEIHPWEQNMANEISNSIMKANIGLNPQIQGNIVRLVMPPLTVERRWEIKKIVHSICEEYKISIRNLRRKEIDTITKQEKDKEITKDAKYAKEKEIQKETDDDIKKIDEIYGRKEKEIMEE
ncbi:MAG: ribosome recycling factor [bacterium]